MIDLIEKVFEAVVGNPPYQIKTGQNTSKDIFPDFQKLSLCISTKTSMIYPASWQKDVSKEDVFLGRFLMDNGLFYSHNYLGEDVFKSAIEKDYPLTIVACNKSYDGEITSNNSISVSRENEYWLNDNSLAVLTEKTNKHHPKLLGVQDSLSISNLEDAGIKYSKTADNEFTVSVFVKEKAGKGSKAEWFYVKESELSPFVKNEDVTTMYSVGMQSAPIGRLGIWKGRIEKQNKIGARIFKPNESFGTTYVSIKTFATEIEAINFASYANTTIFLKLASLSIKRNNFCTHVPDLVDYSNANPVFTTDKDLPVKHEYKGLALEDRLYKFFGLDKAEESLVKSA